MSFEDSIVVPYFQKQLLEYGLDVKFQQGEINLEVDRAMKKAPSKSGGSGINRPEAKLLIQDSKLQSYIVLIEMKGKKGDLIKLDEEGHVANFTKKNEPNYTNIQKYAVNGAVHYANAILAHSSYDKTIAIGINGWLDSNEELETEISVYYVAKENYGIGQFVGNYEDLSFLKPENFDEFVAKIEKLFLSKEEIKQIHQKQETKIDDGIQRLNEKLYNNKELNISALSRIHLIAGSIIANLGVPGKVAPLESSELKSNFEDPDGEIVIRKIKAYLKHKDIPPIKQKLILNDLARTFQVEAYSKPKKGVSLIKEIYIEVIEDLGQFYKVGLNIDFTGKLFNTMFQWLSFAGDDQNDVVLTPRYVANLLAQLARVNRDSYVWDFATGSGGLLVAAMNQMLEDARENIFSPDKLLQKEQDIRTKQVLGIEILPEIYMLAVLNMILMGDGSSNILQEDSLHEFTGDYKYGGDGKFPADAFVLNPPYSAEGNGMIFVHKALNMMEQGYAAILIQDSPGMNGIEIRKKILQKHTLLASIKMPPDLFGNKSSVQTSIYVFKVAEPHQKKDSVRFIDFRNDGYKRSNRKKAKASSNLRNVDRAIERYDEVVRLVRYGEKELEIFTKKEFYEAEIALDGEKVGKDWNFVAKVDTKPTYEDFRKTVSDYLAWEVEQLLQGDALGKIDSHSMQQQLENLENSSNIEWQKFKLGDLFEIVSTPSFNKNRLVDGSEYDYVTRTSQNQGILQSTGFVNKKNINPAGTWSLGLMQMDFFYRRKPWYAGQYVRKIVSKVEQTDESILYFTVLLNSQKPKLLGQLVRDVDKIFTQSIVDLPIDRRTGQLSYTFIKSYIQTLEAERIQTLEAYLVATGLSDYKLTNEEVETLDTFHRMSDN
ncbi:N-6 DNA methylase, partial [Enterococcus hirae]